ncbi:MAG TPA: hypothetical protein VLI39_19505 [Sedimentisphaerales bacterium]|nr:hypothetical protein [Sedimentisphaerales bacterium]
MSAAVDDILNDLIARVGRVRRWLLALSALRIGALGLACISLYIGGYAWLDHRIHFGSIGRLSSLVLFLALLAVGLHFIVRVLRRDMTYANAANYIEGKRSFDQQLVAAVEYYEGRVDYPYSKSLAAQLVRQVDSATQGYRFDSTIEKWQGYLLAGFVLLCACVVGFFVHQNVLFFSSYLARLLRPFSAVQPAADTVLESATGDIVAGVDDPVTFELAVEGRVPESASLVLTRCDPNDANAPRESLTERIELARSTDSDGRTKFTATESFDAPGRFEYRFETPQARSDSHELRVCESPSIDRITAKVFPPGAPPEGGDSDPNGTPATPMQPYEVELADKPLEVLPHSRVELTAQASTPLREATMTGPDGTPVTQPLNGENRFGFEFTADKPSSIQLNAVSVDGLTSGQTKELRVVLKSDARPEFKLVSPDGDCLATDVASIPIAFEVTDDFGLERAELLCELPGREAVVLKSVSPQGGRQVSLAHVFELEEHELRVGDAILFYARARDIDTGHRPTDANVCSEVYLIEIRPYRQYWHRESGGNQSNAAPGLIPEDLIAVLEYTRAVVKKTWTLARSPQSAVEDRPRLQALAEDVQYCASRLTTIRDDPENGFAEGDKAVMNRVLESYRQAETHLKNADPNAALPPSQDAYRVLRMFIDELHLKWTPPESGTSAPQETPEKVKIQEQPQDPKMDKDRIENQLQEMQQKVDSLSKQQQSLKADLAKAMRREEDSRTEAQSADHSGGGNGNPSQDQADDKQAGSSGEGDSGKPTGESGSSQGSQGQNDGEQPASSPQGQSGTQGSQGQQQDGGQASSQANGSGESGGQSQSQGQQSGGRQSGQSGQGQSGQQGQQSSPGQSGNPGNSPGREGTGQAGNIPGQGSAQADAQMRMLQARQKALREQASQISKDMDGLTASDDSSQGQPGREAKGHLDQAVEAMQRLEEHLEDARYGSGDGPSSEGMADLAESAARRLAEAGQTIRRGLLGEGESSLEAAREIAEQLARDAQAYDESLSEAQKQKMQDRLKAAERLLESMAGAQWTTMSSGGGPGMGHVYTKDPHTSPAEAARLLARQFWSMSLKGQNRRSRLMEQESSDVEFFEAETEFFEKAAKFGSQSVQQ